MKKKNLIWIVPLCLLIGYSCGIWAGLPETMNINFGIDEELINFTESMEDFNMTVSHENCPDCICDCRLEVDDLDCFDMDQYTIVSNNALGDVRPIGQLGRGIIHE